MTIEHEHRFVENHTLEDYLIMECEHCDKTKLVWFSELTDEQWKWVIRSFRGEN